jgi:asparagine synthase (glutamine-hydrolysing)
MCGIAGLVGADASRDDVARMTERLVHRGPDASGLWSGEGVALGHRRLAIIDLSAAGTQPMQQAALTLTYNGEIYNYRELRRGLDGPFHSESDTEVLLKLLARDGEGALEQLDGMFAFAAWDAEAGTLLAARDRLGIKPFFWRELPGGGLAFASEIKALLALGPAETDAEALSDFFTYRYVPAPKTIYRGIHKLPAGHLLRWQAGRVTLRRWWQPEATTARRDAAAAGEELGALLAEAVTAHTVADVPLGVFLSGGIDSSSVVACLDHPRTFAVGFDVGSYDELPFANEVARHFDTEHCETTVHGVDVGEALDAAVAHYDEPFGDSSSWATHVVCREARKDVTVALSGDGGDELFGGYGWYAKWFQFGSSRMAAAAATLLPPFSSAGRSIARRGLDPLARYASLVGPFTGSQKRALLTPQIAGARDDDLWALRAHWRDELPPLQRMQWLDLHTFLADDILVKVDRASMAVSLEVRPPLLDHRLVEFALTLHPDLLRHGEGPGKLLLREWLRPRVPTSVLERKKRGFSMPIRRWLEAEPERMPAALARLASAGVLKDARPRRFGSDQAWCLLVLDRWMQRAA